MNKKKLKAISLFSGCGGDSIGMEKAGIEVIGFVEKWDKAIKTHIKNMPNSKIIGEDITKIPDDVFRSFNGKIDIIFAGFPCQGFSNAGKKDLNDPRNKLFWEFVRATNLIQPKWIIGENVKGLLGMVTEDKKEKVVNVIVKAFEEIGYTMSSPVVLNAENFGIPQKRQRLFFLGEKDGGKFDLSSLVQNKIKVGVREIVEQSLEGAMEFNQFDFPDIREKNIDFFNVNENIVVSGLIHPYLSLKMKEKKISFGKRISAHHIELVDLNSPTKTIHCGYKFQPRLFVPLKKGEKQYLRPFTVNELARLQSFADDFVFEGSKEDVITQIGNAVPPKLIEVIIKNIIKKGSNKTKQWIQDEFLI